MSFMNQTSLLAFSTRPRAPRRAFTLVELLVVLFIVGLVSAATLPIILPTLNQRQVQEGSRIVQQALINARFAAMSTGRPAGVRFLPDPIFSGPDNSDLLRPLAYNRMVQLEPAPDFSDGQILIHSPGIKAEVMAQFFINCYDNNLNWREQMIGNPGGVPNTNTSRGPQDPYLIEPRITLRQYKSEQIGMTPTPVEPTSWSWNIRSGDRITIGTQNISQYVIAGPIAPLTVTAGYNGYTYNPERFINMGSPKDMAGWQLPTYFTQPASPIPVPPNVKASNYPYYRSEILFVVNEENRMFNGVDDDGDGYPDPAFDGYDNDPPGIIGSDLIDDPCEIFFNDNGLDPVQSVVKPMVVAGIRDPILIYEALRTAFEWDARVLSHASNLPIEYTIKRRMVPSSNSAEVGLPADVVLDATTALFWLPSSQQNIGTPQLAPPNVNFTKGLGMAERSRVPIDPLTRYVDIIFQPDGQVVTSAATSVNNAPFQVPFYHLWLTDRADIFPPTDPTQAIGKIFTPRLPISQGSVLQSGHMNVNNTDWALKNERRMITIQTRTGRITSQTIEYFDATDPSKPYEDAQKGVAEVGQ